LRCRAGRFFLGRCACVFDNCFNCSAHSCLVINCCEFG
jgi:hypothetical protein